ncbi:SpoIIE family protein phosphatase [candidate division KSB1 bacterium]|nr:SpoIIE family protein phosphatase [candidate division KSB1 bacterium]
MIPLFIAVFYLSFGVILILLGLIIVKENSRRRLNQITGMMMFFAGMGPIFGAFGLFWPDVTAAGLSLEPFRFVFTVWEFFFPLLLLFSFYFPYEHAWSKKHRILPVLLFLPPLVHVLLLAFFSSPDEIQHLIQINAMADQMGSILEPVRIFVGLMLSLLRLLYTCHQNCYALINLIYIMCAIAIMWTGYRELKIQRQRRQIQFVLWGICISMGLYALTFLLPALQLFQMSDIWTHLFTILALICGAGSIAWAIIRYQFLDIHLIIRRGLMYSILFAFLIGVYLLIYSHGRWLLISITGTRVPVLEILFIIVALLFFQPVFSLLEKWVESLFFRDAQDYRHVLVELSHEIMATLDPVELQDKIATTLTQALGVEHAALLISDVEDDLICNQGGIKMVFPKDESWISLLRESPEPIGFDDLSLRVENSRGLSRLRSLHAYLVVPLIHLNHLVGIFVVGEKTNKSRFRTEDWTILSVLSSQTAVAIENGKLVSENLIKQRMEEDLRLAREIQRNLLPSVYPFGERFELVGYNLPSKEVGGDYYDFVSLPDNRLGIAIGDISGKGIPAALLMSNLQAALRVSASLAKTSKDVIHQVNQQISQTTAPEKFATFFYGILDQKSLGLEYTNAGHNYPIHVRKGGECTLLKKGGLVIGIYPDTQYETGRISMTPGDALIMYTDGLTESLNPEEDEYGEERLLKLLEKINHLSAQQILDLILEEVVQFTQGQLYADDLTMVILKIK